ncbi:hypothetical protein ACWD04_34025, partial [Streptomyces sp. NPDC002911]
MDKHVGLADGLADFRVRAGVVSRGVSGAVGGEFDEAFVRAMRVFGSGEGRDYVVGLERAARDVAEFGEEFAFEVVKTNKAVVIYASAFWVEWVATLATAWINPFAAVKLAALRVVYGFLMKYLLTRFAVWVGARAGVMVGVQTVMEVSVEAFAQFLTREAGFRTKFAGEFLRGAARAGAIGGAVGWVVPGVGEAVVGWVRRGWRGAGRGFASEVDGVVGRGVGERVGGGVVRDGVVGGLRGVGGGGSFGSRLGVVVGGMANGLERGGVDGVVRAGFVREVGGLFERGLVREFGGGRAARLAGEAWAS